MVWSWSIYPVPPYSRYSLSIALYTLLSLMRRRLSCWDTNIPITSATTCAIHRSNPTDAATLMMAAHKSVNRADIGMGTSSSNAEINLGGASKTETLNSERATSDNMSSPGSLITQQPPY